MLTCLAQVPHRTALLPLTGGMPVARAMLQREPVVQSGRALRLVAGGAGFIVSVEGELVRPATAGSQVVAGLAPADGVLTVSIE